MIEIGLTTSAREPDGTKVGDGVEWSRSDAAQQPSASVWLMAVAEPCADLCIGQSPPLAQQAILASGVAAQPAQRPTPADDSTMLSAMAAMRLVRTITWIE